MENVSIVIVDKNFNVQNLQGLVIRSEKYANKIKIQFPKTYEGEDLTGKIFILKCTNANGVYFETLLPKTVTAEYIELLWTVTAEFTTVSGVLKIAIFAESANYSLGTTMSKVIVEESPQYSIPIDDFTVLESYMVEIRVAADKVERDRAEALESKNVAVSAKDEAESAKDEAALSQADALTSKSGAEAAQTGAEAAQTGAEAAQTGAEAARDVAVTAADDAVVRMQAFESGAIAVQVETNKNEISGLKNYLKIERYGVKISKANSSPAGAMEYMYDAVGKQPAYMDFATGNFNYGDWADAFFIKQNRPVMLDTSWNVVEELDKTDQTKKTDGSPSSISSDASNLNAFAEFPQAWYKTWEDSTHQYFAISNVQYDETYKCDVCKDAAGKIADKWYFPMYDGSLISGKMRSLADKAVSVSKTAAQEIGYCTLHGASWYTLDKEQIHVFVMLAELISKNRNSQQAFGDQVSLATNTAGINTGSLKSFGQFKGYNDGIHATKMFYCETGSLGYFIRYAGHVTNANSEYLVKTYPPYNLDGAGYINTGVITAGTSGSYIKGMAFTPDGIFANLTGGSATTYWPDVQWYAPNCYARWRGAWNVAAYVGLRCVFVAYAASATYLNFASALSGRKPV